MPHYPRDAVEEYDSVEIDCRSADAIPISIGDWIYEGDDPLYRIDRIYRTKKYDDLYWLVVTDQDGRTNDNVAAASVLVQQNPGTGERWVKHEEDFPEEE